jgi:uncharacterized protein
MNATPVTAVPPAAPPASRRPSVAAAVVLFLLAGYRRLVSPLLAPRCRFYPSCSAYAVEAVRSHGALVGGLLAVRRLLRCHPFHPGGFDPVPPRRTHRFTGRLRSTGAGPC